MRLGGCALLVLLATLLGVATAFVSRPLPLTHAGAARRARAMSGLRMAEVLELGDATGSFEDVVLKSDSPVLVDFYANWCGPCKLVEPLVKKTAEKYDGKLKVVKVNTEVYEALVGEYNIYGLPLLAVFVDGKVIGQHEGAAGSAQMEKLLQGALPELVA